MKPRAFRNLFSLPLVVATFGCSLFTGSAHAASLTWDGNGVSAPNPAGGTGVWEAAATGTWWNGTSNVVWPAPGGTNNDAVFDVAPGTVNLAPAGITANDLTFNFTGYIVAGSTLTLNGAAPVLTTATDVSATILSTVAGSGVVKSGPGTVTLGGNNAALAGITVSQGTLQSDALGALGTGTVTLGDANSGANSQTLFYNAFNTSAVNVVVSSAGTGDALIKWSQDVTGSAGKSTGSANDFQITLNRMVTFQSTSGGKQITPFITGGVGAGNTAIRVNGGTQVTLTAGMNATNTAVSVNDFTGDILVTGNTKLQLQNRAYQSDTAPYWNGALPDASSLTIEAGSSLAMAHGAETIGGLNGAGSVSFDTQQANGHALSVGGGNGSGVFTGTMSTPSGKVDAGLAKIGTGTQELSGSGITYGNATILTNGILKLTNTTGWNSTIAMDVVSPVTLQLNAPNAADAWTFSKLINGGSTAAKIEKTGSGTVVLNPAAGSTFVGAAANALTITSGRLYANAPFTTAPAVSVGTGGLLGGKSAVGAVTVATGGILEGGQASTGVLTADSLALNSGASMICTPATGGAAVVVTNALTTSGGTGSVVINPLTVPSADGSYHLLQFGSLSGAASDFRFATPTRALTIQQNGNFIDMVVNNTTAGYPVWTGEGSGEWSYASGLSNWKLSTTSGGTSFLTLDNVKFDDSVGAGNTQLDVSVSDLSLGTMTFNNSAVDYILGGTKDITAGSLIKTGTGRLTITGAYSYPGGSTLAGGTVSVAGETALGTGVRIFDGGTLEYTGVTATWTRASTVNAGGGTILVTDPAAILTHGGALSGTGVLTKGGDGTLVLGQTSGVVASPLVINGGTLDLNYGAGNVTYSGDISGSTGVLKLSGTGASPTTGITFTGNNSFTGQTHIYGRRIFLDSPTGNAINGDVVIKESNWAYHGLSLNRSEQIADTAVLRFEQTGAYDFRLNGKTETLAGIENTGPDGIIENGGHDGGNDADGLPVGLLIVAPAADTSHTYTTALRDQNNVSGNNKLAFTKAGAGTQILGGGGISYTGATNVTGGMLVLQDATSFGSKTVTIGNGTVLAPKGTTTLAGTTSLVIQSGGILAPDTTEPNTGSYTVPVAQALSGAGTVNGGVTVAGTLQLGAGTDILTVAGNLGMSDGSKIACQVGGTWAAATTNSVACDTYAITATSANPILVTIPASGVTGFSETSKSFPLIRGANGGSGFQADAFVVDAAGFNAATGAIGQWSVQQNGNDLVLVYTGNNAGPNGDSDQDGIPNIIEFMTGTDPDTGGSGNPLAFSVNGNDLVIRFNCRDDAEYLNPTIEYSTSLAEGSWIVAAASQVSVEENGSDPDIITVTIPGSGTTPSSLFARLRVVIP